MSRDELRDCFENAAVGEASIDLAGRWIKVNPSLLKMLGYTREQLDASSYQGLIHPEDRHLSAKQIHNLLAGEIPVIRTEKRFRRADGTHLWCRVNKVVVRDAAGLPLRFVSQIEDIQALREAAAEKERMERKLLETAKLESLGVLAGGIAHDFNNILTGILGGVELLASESSATAAQRKICAEVSDAALRAGDLCKQMLAYSGRGKFFLSRVDLPSLAEETSALVKASVGKKATVEISVEGPVPLVEADLSQVRQVMMNLIINAAEAMENRPGRIRVRLGSGRIRPEDQKSLLVFPPEDSGDFVWIEVSDNGAGISPENLSRIFDPFYTTKVMGRGLGLAAVQGIARGHKGGLSVVSEVGHGTTFRFYLPVRDLGDAPQPKPVLAQDQDWQGAGYVLVVDDEDLVRTTTVRQIERFGFSVVGAENGRVALEAFTREPDRYRLVVLDMTMPEMDGVTTLAELQKIRPGLKVLLISGYSESEIADRFAGQELAGFLQKPFTTVQLKHSIRSILG